MAVPLRSRFEFRVNHIVGPAPRVLRRRGQDPVGVYVEADLDLRQSARRRRDAFEPEMAQRAIVARHFAFAL